MLKGLRLRSGNVQFGEHALHEELFSEPRFNVSSVGEVHVVDRRIVPNGRRDHFERNAHFHNLLNHLAPTAREISRRCRTIRRKWLREFESQRLAAAEAIKIIRQRSVGKAELARFAHSGERCLLQMEKIAAMNVFVPDGIAAPATISKLRQKLNGLKGAVGDASPLAGVPKAQRKNYERFFELICKCSTNQMAAKALIDRILQTIE